MQCSDAVWLGVSCLLTALFSAALQAASVLLELVRGVHSSRRTLFRDWHVACSYVWASVGLRGVACMQDPEAFQPERWMAKTPKAAAVPENGWVPFGEGMRACIGLRWAPRQGLERSNNGKRLLSCACAGVNTRQGRQSCRQPC